MTFHVLHADEPGASEPAGRGRDCLVVDDDPLSRTALARQLADLGFRVRESGAARQALDIWRDWRPPVMLIDCVLPEWDGYGLATAIREHERRHADAAAATLLIAVSGYSDPAHWRRCALAGMDGTVAKPARLRDHAHWLGLSKAEVPAQASQLSREAELRCLYTSTCETDLQAISRSLASRQLDQVRQHAHRIEGASRVLGVDAVAEAARVLGLAARVGQGVTGLGRLASALEHAYRAWLHQPVR